MGVRRPFHIEVVLAKLILTREWLMARAYDSDLHPSNTQKSFYD